MEIVEKYLAKQRLTVDEDLIFNFFIVFSRFEYALKRSGYLRITKADIWTDFDKFASELGTKFKPSLTPELADAVKYLKDNPPKKQIVENNNLDWSAGNDDKEQPIINLMLVYIRRVRNNLFHGGKFPMRPIEEPARNEKLLNSSLVILNTCLGLDSKVRDYFLNDD